MCSEIFYNNEIKQSFINEKNSYKNKNFIESWFKKSTKKKPTKNNKQLIINFTNKK